MIWLALVLACTAPSRTRKALADEGYTAIEVTGYAWLACSEDDTFATSFRALGPRGDVVEGAVCCGLWKYCTVRH